MPHICSYLDKSYRATCNGGIFQEWARVGSQVEKEQVDFRKCILLYSITGWHAQGVRFCGHMGLHI